MCALQAWAANYWAKKGCPRRKIIVGMALYGHSFTLAADDTHGLGATTKGGGKPGLFTNEAGLYSFYEVRPYDEDLLVPDFRINVVESFENVNYRL